MTITSSQLLWASRQFKRYYEGHFASLLEREGLTMRELHVLLFLINHPDRDTARDVAELRGLPKSQVSGAVDLLAARGLLERLPDRTDRRVVRLTLTEPGAALGREARELQNACGRAVLSPLQCVALVRALGVNVKEIAACADSVMFCLSKGLCAPVGSMLVGSREYIERARRNRKIVGGGMRQCGFLAAAGLIALEVMTKRLQEDHDNAKYMAQRLQKMPGVSLDMNAVEINMVFFKLDAPKEVIDTLPEKMLEAGVKINGIEDGEFRFVATNDTSREDIDRALDAFEAIVRR